MANIRQNWDDSWTATSINSSNISDESTATTAAISLNLKSAVEVSVTVP